MATIKPYDTAAGKRYRVRYRKPDGAQTDKRGFKTKKEAELFLASTTISKATGDYVDPQAGKITIGQLGPTWLAGKKSVVKVSQYASLESSWRTHVQPEWADRAVASIKKSEVQTWIADLRGRRSATVVLRAHGILAGILDSAMHDGRISKNQARAVQLPRKGRAGKTYLTHDQLQRLAAASKYPTLMLVLGYTGLRWGEVSALRVKHVNQVRRRFSIEENAVLVGSVIHPGTPKTHEHRTVPYPRVLARRIRELCEGRDPNELLFGDGTHYMRLPHPSHSWLNEAARKAREQREREVAAAKAAGRKLVLTPVPTVSVHELRHTAASLAVSSGANPKAVQRMLGHASAAMTLDTYADLFEDDLDGVADRLSAAAEKAGLAA
ncbi:site-specific integrase [Leucobacter muris]|nr:site-specific integrase [Leucobacter muris]